MRLVGLKELAGLIGLSYGTARVYRTTSPHLLPPEDDVIDGKPVWRYATVEAWKEKRATAASAETD